MEFLLRPWRESDIESVAKHADNKKIADNLRDAFPHPYRYEDAAAYVRSCLNAPEEKQCVRAIEVDGEAVGSIGVFVGEDVCCKSAEIGYWLAEEYWGNGIMSRAIRLLCEEAFARYDLVRIYAEPFAHNVGSKRALEKAGFELEGVLRRSIYKNGKVFDSCIYGLFCAEEKKPKQSRRRAGFCDQRPIVFFGVK